MGMGPEDDLRPGVWVGHVAMGVPDVALEKAFFLCLGMRDVEPGEEIGILELRGGNRALLHQVLAEKSHRYFLESPPVCFGRTSALLDALTR